MKKYVYLLALALAGQALVGCNTVEGLGKDIKSSGKAIERAGSND